MKRASIFIITLFAASRILAATYYVDFVGGNNASAGTSTGAAWKHCPGDPNATSTAASATLSAGDTVIFKGGVTYNVGSNSRIALSWDGSSGSPITYDGNSAGTWGTGKAIISNNHGTGGSGAAAFGVGSTTRVFLTFKNFSIYGIGGASSLPTDMGSAVAANVGKGITFFSGTYNNITVQDCDFAELGYYFNEKPMNAASIDGFGLYFSGTLKSILVTNCIFKRTHTGVAFYYTGSVNTNLTVANCEFYDSFVWGVDIAPTASSAGIDYLTIRNSSFHDYWQHDEGTWTGYDEWPHTDGIFFRSDYSGITYGTNNNIHGNAFYSTNGTGKGTADIYITEGPSVNIYNNTLAWSKKGRIVYLNNSFNPSNPQVVNIFNNSFVVTYNSAISIEGPGWNGLTAQVKNNAFYDTQTGSGNNFLIYISTTNSLLGVLFDYNIYKSFNTGSKYIYYNGGEHDVASINASSKKWETNGISSDPLYVNLGSASAPLSADLRLQSSSPAIDEGLDLSAYFTTDKAGNARGATWDLGAYEYAVSGSAFTRSIRTGKQTSSGKVVWQ